MPATAKAAVFFGPGKHRSTRLGMVLWAAVLTGLVVVASGFLKSQLSPRDLPGWARALKARPNLGVEAPPEGVTAR